MCQTTSWLSGRRKVPKGILTSRSLLSSMGYEFTNNFGGLTLGLPCASHKGKRFARIISGDFPAGSVFKPSNIRGAGSIPG